MLVRIFQLVVKKNNSIETKTILIESNKSDLELIECPQQVINSQIV